MGRSDITPVPSKSVVVSRLESYARHARGALAPNTERALKSDVAIFTVWCASRHLEPLPASPETVATFIDHVGDLKAPATVRRYVSSISTFHQAAGVENPTTATEVRLALKRMRRAKGSRQKQATPLNRPAVEKMMAVSGDNLIGLRDAALLAIAYDTLARRSELVALDVDDITFAEDGTGTVLIRRSKTDQAGDGSVRFLASDSVVHLERWLKRVGASDGPLIRSVTKGAVVGRRLRSEDVARIYKRLAARAGLNVDGVSGHSTRVGAAQDLTAAGFGLAEVMQSGGWKTGEMVARYTENLAARRGAMAKLAVLQDRF